MTWIVLIALYFVPSFVAWGRKNHTSAIFALNLFLGWTGIGWIVALVMALWSNPAAAAPREPVESDWRTELGEIRRDAQRLSRLLHRHDESPAQP